MAVRFAGNAPRGIEKKLEDWAFILQEASRSAQAGNTDLALSEGYQVKFLSVDQISKGDLFDTCVSRCWRYLVLAGNHALGEIEIDDDLKPVAFYEGAGKDGLLEALEVAHQLEGQYKAVVLMAPALKFVAICLRSQGKELIIPYSPSITPLQNLAVFPAEDAIKVLRPAAQEVKRAYSGDDDEPQGG